MNLSRLCGAILTLLFFGIKADANPSTLYTLSYNFPISGNGAGPSGGGASASLNGVNVEIFCDDFAHQIWIPYGPPAYTGYTDVNVSSLTTGSDLSLTRFGGVTSWTAVNLAGDATDSNTINNANALARYQMAAYLVMQYHLQDVPTDDPYNDGIQEAIWTLMDPTGLTATVDPSASPTTLPNVGDGTSALKQAAQWYTNANSDKSFLASFHILSENVMYNCGVDLKCGGFQEQLFDPVGAVPEPRGQLFILLGLLCLCAFRYQRSLKRS
jgi:hypothetical protein